METMQQKATKLAESEFNKLQETIIQRTQLVHAHAADLNLLNAKIDMHMAKLAAALSMANSNAS
jgi:hypothetical protein